jgi:acetyltransferase
MGAPTSRLQINKSFLVFLSKKEPHPFIIFGETFTLTVPHRFDPERVFHPASVAVSGTGTALGGDVIRRLQDGGFRGPVGDDAETLANADLAIVADDPADVPAALLAHAARGARGAIVLSDAVDLAAAARAAGIRVMGPHSFGLIMPGIGLNASRLPVTPAAGKVALVGQSAALARTVIDWAVPNGVGFSQIIGIGGNTDIGFGLVLDHLSRDPGTSAIFIEIDRLRSPRLFHSAARAAARLRPVIAIAPGLRLRDPSGNAHAGVEAAFARAGVLLTGTIGEFLAAAETLTRVRPAHGESLAIIANSVSAGRLAADEVLARGLTLARLSPETRQVIGLSLGTMPPETGPIAAWSSPVKLAEIAALLSSAPEVGGILVVHAPSGGRDDTDMAALIACAQTVKIPLLIAAMGQAAGAINRQILAQAGLACFDTPEAAISGFRHLIRNRRNRAAARELPPSKVLDVAPDLSLVQSAIETARAGQSDRLVQDAALVVVAAYGVPVVASRRAATPEAAALAATTIGFPVVLKFSHPEVPTNRLAGSIALDLRDGAAVRAAARAMRTRLAEAGVALAGGAFLVQQQAPRGVMLRIRVADHPVLGPMISFGAGGGDPDDLTGLAADLPPLNLALAQGLIARSPVLGSLAAHRGQPAVDTAAIAAALVRISQLVIDTPEIRLLDLDPLFAGEAGVIAASARILLRPPGAKRLPLVISPYPSELTSHYDAKGESFTLRPIRPEDGDAHAALFRRFTPEDMRFRFFSSIRNMPAEQITRMTDIDYGREMAIIAVRDATGETAGAARLVRNDTDGQSAEFAVAVEPAAKGQGLASALMRAIIAWGRNQGVAEITGQILADNTRMLAFVRRLGFTIHRIPSETDIVEARLTP